MLNNKSLGIILLQRHEQAELLRGGLRTPGRGPFLRGSDWAEGGQRGGTHRRRTCHSLGAGAEVKQKRSRNRFNKTHTGDTIGGIGTP